MKTDQVLRICVMAIGGSFLIGSLLAGLFTGHLTGAIIGAILGAIFGYLTRDKG